MHVEDTGTSTEVSYGVAIVSESHQLLWSNLLMYLDYSCTIMHVIVLLHSGQVYSYLGECSLMILGLVTCVWHAACGVWCWWMIFVSPTLHWVKTRDPSGREAS